MSITDDVRAEARQPSHPSPGGPSGGGGGQRDGQFDKSPPQDLAAEQSVLGGMLLSKDAIADVVEILKSHDFYRPIHATVFDTILDLYGRGEPADAITVAAALSDSGDLVRIGGVPYLHTLVESVPTAANASYYARIVSERAVLRRLVEAGTKIVQLGYGTGGNGGRDVDDIVDLAQQAVYDVTERRVSEDFAILADMLQPTLDEIEAVGATGGMMTGVPTGFSDLDRLLNGLHPGQLIIVAGRPGLGKALALDTPLATPDGWTTMAEVAVGDRLVGADGRPTTVIATSEIMSGRPCFEVRFSDGSTIVADGSHQWSTYDHPARRSGRSAQVRTTREIAATLHSGTDRRLNHSVAGPLPLDLPERPLPIGPYTIGALLGAGHRATEPFTWADPEVLCHLEAEGHPSTELPSAVGQRGEHIPAPYLRASERQRRAVLAGLLDTNGTVTVTGGVRFSSPSQRLVEDVRELLATLGYRTSAMAGREPGAMPDGSTGHAVEFTTGDEVFRLHRKALLHKERNRTAGGTGPSARFIVDVRPVPGVPVKCVSIDNADKLYLAGSTMIPTHNSTASMDFARNAAIRSNCASAIFSLEMSKIEIVMRLLSAEARVPLHVLRSGQLSDDDWTKLARRMGEISEAPIFVDDTPSMNLMEIRAKARRLKQRHDLKLIVVDYLQLMTSPKRTESRQQEVADLSRGLKLLAKEVECPVIAVSQLNRGPEQRTDKRPQLSDLRESGCLPASTRILRADTGAEVTIGELLSSGATDVPVWSADESLRYRARTLTHAFPSGVKEVFTLRLASGRTVDATANHPFLTFDGWKPLGELAPGSKVAVPRHVPAPLTPVHWADAEVVTLARQLTSAGPDGFIPDPVSALPKRQIALFIRHLWTTGGSVSWDPSPGHARIFHSFASRRIADRLALLLLRFGIQTRITSSRRGYQLHISDRDDQLRFLREVAVQGALSVPAERCLTELASRCPATTRETVPYDVWSRVRRVLLEQEGMARRQFATTGARTHGQPTGKDSPSRQRLTRVAAVLDEAGLDMHATNDMYWDEIVAIESVGEQPVYDATVLGTHNFIANGIAVHNSIEQDADVVILLHRDDYYDKESPRAGEADFIVAKHRNGPTDTVTVAAQLHLSRFVDMAIV